MSGAHARPSRLERFYTPAVISVLAGLSVLAAFAISAFLSPGSTVAQARTRLHVRRARRQPVVVDAIPDRKPVFRLSARASRITSRWYTVRKGDTLSAIAGRYLGGARNWQGLFAANMGRIANPNVITPGQSLRLADDAVTARVARRISAALAPPKHWGRTVDVSQAAPPAAAPAAPAPAAPAASYSGAYPGGAFGACVVARESGGNSQVMNATGHYGLYQFSYSTWVAYGGNGADFGRASAAEQNQVFANALAQGGQSNWAPYDGC